MKTVIIVQSRMTSTRLPGKILKPVLGKPLLEYQIERLKKITAADEIVIATTTNREDEVIVDLCNKLAISCYRGSETDVLARYYEAAVKHQADIVVRITSDCPVVDPEVCQHAIDYFLSQPKYNYIRLEHYPRGLDAEIFSFNVLADCFRKATLQPDREHVTPFIYRHPEDYRIKRLYCSTNYSHHRWTVDTPEDFELIKKIIEAVYPIKPSFSFIDILNILEKNPDWYFINAGVRQKQYGE